MRACIEGKADVPDRVSALLNVISSIRMARQSVDLETLSDAEINMEIAADLARRKSEQLPIACAFAVYGAVGPSLEPAIQALGALGISDVGQEQITEMRRSAEFEAFEDAMRDFDAEGSDVQIEQIRALALACASFIANQGD